MRLSPSCHHQRVFALMAEHIIEETALATYKVTQATYKVTQTTVRVATEGPQVLYGESDEHHTAAGFLAESKEAQPENELPLDEVHNSNERPVDRGCFGGAPPAEKEMIMGNNNIYTTRDIGEQEHIVYGAPSSGVRRMLQKETDESERDFWKEAKPVTAHHN